MSIFEKSKTKYTDEDIANLNLPLVAKLSLFCSSTNTNHYFLVKPQSYKSYKDHIIQIARQTVTNIEDMLFELCKETIVYPVIDDSDLNETILPPTFLTGLSDKIREVFYPTSFDYNFHPELDVIPSEVVKNELIKARQTNKFAYWYKLTGENGLECNFIISKLKSSDRIRVIDLLVKKMDDIFEQCFSKYNQTIKDKMRQCLIPSTKSAIPLVEGNEFYDAFSQESNFEELNLSARTFNDMIVSVNDSFSLDDEIAKIYTGNVYYCDEKLDNLPYAFLAELFNELRREMTLVNHDVVTMLSNKMEQRLPSEILDKISHEDLMVIVSQICSEIESNE